MSLEHAILEAVRELPTDKQHEILEHATRLRQESDTVPPRGSSKGLWADLRIADEIDEDQRRMWKNYPREHI